MSSRVAVRENKQLLRSLHETGFAEGPAAMEKYFAPTYAAHGLWGDLEGLKTTLRAILEAYPNVEWVIDDMIAELDKVAVRAQIRIRTSLGEVRSFRSTMVYRINNNRIVEQWGHGDPLF